MPRATALLQKSVRLGRRAGAAALDAVLPQTCLACDAAIRADAGPLCVECAGELSAARAAPYCSRCGRTIRSAARRERGCAYCRSEPFWNVVQLVRIGPYEAPLRPLLLNLKFHGAARIADCLGMELAQRIREHEWCSELDAIVAVPMHWLRRLQRPGDHAELLAAGVAQRLHVPLLRAVRRRAYGPSQTEMFSRARRFENVRGCFSVRGWPPWRRTDLNGMTICIVDNLAATGATLHEMSKTLRRHGARRIYAAIVARSIGPGDVEASTTTTVDNRQ
jgi:ComF family protein